MSFNVPQYRISTDDLPDADHKLARGIGPLLDALNRCLGAVTLALQSLALPAMKTTSFTTDASGSAYVDLGLGAPSTDVWVTGLVPKDGTTLASTWVMSWIPRPAGARLLFVGLAVTATYNLRVRYL